MKLNSKNSAYLALVFLAGTTWANAQSSEQAEGALRHRLEGARVAQSGPAVPVRPGEAQAERENSVDFSGWALSVAAAPVAPPRLSAAQTLAVTGGFGAWRSSQYDQKQGSAEVLRQSLYALSGPLTYPIYTGCNFADSVYWNVYRQFGSEAVGVMFGVFLASFAFLAGLAVGAVAYVGSLPLHLLNIVGNAVDSEFKNWSFSDFVS